MVPEPELTDLLRIVALVIVSYQNPGDPGIA
jgi:hypothetical protein